MLTSPPGVRSRRGQRRRCGRLGEREVRDTLRHQILENFDVAVGGSSMPDGEICVKRNWRCHNQLRPALTSVCTCMGRARLEIRLDQKIRITHGGAEKYSRLCCSINSLKIVQGQIDRSIGDGGNQETSLDTVQIAVSCSDPDVFLLTGHSG